jgi:hypothetical protein
LECPECGSQTRGYTCRKCGWKDPRAGKATTESGGAYCPACHYPLRSDGFCDKGQGYAKTLPRSPAICPTCRSFLEWGGHCFGCHGAHDGRREHWSVPGHRHELVEDHWVQVELGPFAVPSPEISNAALKILEAVMSRSLTPAEAHERMAKLMPGYPEAF